MVDVCLLGTGGMMPLPGRYLTSLLIASQGKMILIDCGEGTQVTLKMCGWGFKAIEAICFTHFHADHIAGLPGMLLTIANSGKTTPLTIIGPIGLETVVNGLRVVAPHLPFEIIFIEVSNDKADSFDIHGFKIDTLPLEHGMTCVGYNINIARQRKFDALRAESENIPKVFWNKLQKGEEIFFEGKQYTPDMVLGEDRKGIKISYCTDTRPTENMISFIKEADLFICEGMYGEDEYIVKAMEYKHMLFSEAAVLAKNANVKELWLTHFSPSLLFPEEHLDVAQKIFLNTKIGEDRLIKEIKFDK